MTTVVLVHGTGVRKASFDDTFAAFTENLARIRPHIHVAPCFWGEDCGSRLNLNGVSIPSGYSSRGGTAESEDDAHIGRWARLEADPLYELRRLSTGHDRRPELPPNAPRPGSRLRALASTLADDDAVAAAARAAGVAAELRQAIDNVLGSQEGAAALHSAGAAGTELTRVMARAIVATAICRTDRTLDGLLAVDGTHRDHLVRSIVVALGGSDRSVLGVAADLLLATGITKPAERRRAAITNAAAPMAGDVVLYLTRGAEFRAFLAETLASQAAAHPGDDIVVVAHSLGGIVAVDLFIAAAVPQVSMLVTVGSQAPLLYELNALPALPFGSRLPNHMPHWVNIYDQRDLLGFAAAAVFPGRVTDRTVDNGAPFPRSHSAYFRERNFFDVLDEELP